MSVGGQTTNYNVTKPNNANDKNTALKIINIYCYRGIIYNIDLINKGKGSPSKWHLIVAGSVFTPLGFCWATFLGCCSHPYLYASAFGSSN